MQGQYFYKHSKNKYFKLSRCAFNRIWSFRLHTFRWSSWNGNSVLAAALTMSLLILPVIIVSSQEAIRAVPGSVREASFGLGANKWQTIRKVVYQQHYLVS